jgi:hypothetical protein
MFRRTGLKAGVKIAEGEFERGDRFPQRPALRAITGNAVNVLAMGIFSYEEFKKNRFEVKKTGEAGPASPEYGALAK